MSKQEIYHLHPTGWENDPEEERFKVSTLDYLTVCTYNNYALIFRVSDSDKPRVAEILKAGLEKTLSQVRHICGTIEKDPLGGHSFVKRKDSTVTFVVQWLDSFQDNTAYPTFDEIENANFCTSALGDLTRWSVAPMTYGEKPEAHPIIALLLQLTRPILFREGWCSLCITTITRMMLWGGRDLLINLLKTVMLLLIIPRLLLGILPAWIYLFSQSLIHPKRKRLMDLLRLRDIQDISRLKCCSSICRRVKQQS